MSTDNPRIRFMANNLASLNVNAFSFSSETTGFEASNAFNSFRSSTWRTTGHFEITTSNQNLYINDGSDKTAIITAASYTTAEALRAEIQTQLNTVSSGWTVAYDSPAGTYSFTLSNSGSVTLRLSQTTNAIHNTLGFTSTTDQTGLTFNANEQRNHTNEFIKFDFGYITPVTFIGVIGDIAESFGLSSTANVTLEGNNIDDFTAPPFSSTLTITEQGIYQFNVTDPITSYRFWRLNFVDQFNSIQGPNLEFGNIYMGDFQTLERQNLTVGFRDTLVDPSTRTESQGGVLFFDKRTKYTDLSNITIRYLEDADKQVIKDVFANVGTTEPFYVSLDPQLQINSDITEFTKFVIFNDEPTFTSIGSCFFNTVLNLREVV